MTQQYNLKIKAGVHYRLRLRWYNSDGTPKLLNDIEAKMTLKSSYASSVELLTLTIDHGIYVTPAEGLIEIIITDEQTRSIGKPRDTMGVYDLKITMPNGFTDRLIGGTWKATPAVTD